MGACGDTVEQSYQNLCFLKSPNLIDVISPQGVILGKGYGYSATTQNRIDKMAGKKPWRSSDPTVQAMHDLSQQIHLDHLSDEERAHMAVVIASSRGPTSLLETTISKYYATHSHSSPSLSLNPRTSPTTTFSVHSSRVAADLKLGGMSLSLSSACTSSLQALGIAFKLIQCGFWNQCLVGGVEDPLTPYVYSALKSSKVLASEPYRIPALQAFGQHRSGMIPGRGVALAYLSSQPSNPHCIATLLGFSSTTEHAGMVGLSPNALGLQKAIRGALTDAQISADQVELITVHGSGTKLGDREEMGAIKAIFGHLNPLPNLWITSWGTGHTLGASGLIKVALSIQAMENGHIPSPPYQIDDCTAPWVPHRPLYKPITHKICCVLGLGFGGSSTAIIIQGI